MFFLHVCATHSSITNQEEGMGVRVWVRIGIKSETWETYLERTSVKQCSSLGD